MKIEERYTWMVFYEELADKLLPYKKDRSKLIAKILSMYEGLDLKVPKLDSTPAPVDIDPYTVFGLFNKGISDLNRRKLVAAIAKEFEILSPIPRVFHGVPTLSPLNAAFYAFVGDERRKEQDIDNLWWVFEAEIALAENDSEETRSSFVSAYDSTVGQFGLGWKLTMGLYWARPHA